MLDVVIPVADKDLATLPQTITSVRANLPVRRVFVVSPSGAAIRESAAEGVTDSCAVERSGIPSLTKIASLIGQTGQDVNRDRAGWLFQQLVKLAAPDFISDLSHQFFVVDADLLALRPMYQQPEPEPCKYVISPFENYPTYATHFRRLFGTDPPIHGSPIAHHMLFDRELLSDFKTAVARATGLSWPSGLLETADFSDGSAMSEYSLYVWWLIANRPRSCKRIHLQWADLNFCPTRIERAILRRRFDFVTSHSYRRRRFELSRFWFADLKRAGAFDATRLDYAFER